MKQLNDIENYENPIHPKQVEKEIIGTLYFPSHEVLFSASEITKRKDQLHKANILGNINNVKVCIYFEDIEGLKKVETTIWAVTDKAVILKKNTIIPIHRIVKIQFI